MCLLYLHLLQIIIIHTYLHENYINILILIEYYNSSSHLKKYIRCREPRLFCFTFTSSRFARSQGLKVRMVVSPDYHNLFVILSENYRAHVFHPPLPLKTERTAVPASRRRER